MTVLRKVLQKIYMRCVTYISRGRSAVIMVKELREKLVVSVCGAVNIGV